MVFEVNSLRPIGVNPTTGNTIWYYSTTADTLAAVFAVNYFQADDSSIGLNDPIMIQATDGVSFVSVAAIDGSGNITLKLFDQYAFPDADEIFVDTTNLNAGGTFLTQDDVQDALEYLVTRINLKVQNATSVGSGNAIFAGTDITDPTNRVFEFRRLTGADSELDINVITVGDTIELEARNTLLRQGITSTTGASIIRNANTGGELDLRGFTSDSGSIDIATEGVDLDFNIAAAGVDTTELADDAVTAAKLGTNAVTNVKVGSSAIDSAELATDSVTNSKVANGAIASANLDTSLNNEIDGKQEQCSNTSATGAVVFINGDEFRRLVAGSGININTVQSGDALEIELA